MQTKCRLGGAYSASAKLLIKDEARRIASNIAKLPDLLGKSWSAEWGIKIDRATEETLMSRKQRQPLFMMATFTLLIGLNSLATAAENLQCPKGGCQKARMERWCIMRDEPNCAYDPDKANKTTKKVVNPKGGSTGPTAPPKPTQGNVHR